MERVELWLEAERDHLPVWLPVMLGAGIAAWFILPLRAHWWGVILAGLALASSGVATGLHRRLARVLLWSGLALALGCALAWWRAERVRHEVLARPVVAELSGRVERIEARPAEGKVRLTLDLDEAPIAGLVRVTATEERVAQGLAKGSMVKLKARLSPPPGPVLPGGYDFARAAWFSGLGATGIALSDVRLLDAPRAPGLRERLSRHVRQQVEGSAGGIAAAFASGDRGGIDPADEDAMRDSGLTHLLSISGLHITAVIGATMLIALRLLALSPALALRWPLILIAGAVGAATGVGYTLLTGAEVPTIRSCIAALLVLAGMALGREALTLRLVATGALLILLLWPEALMGASFQLSFAAMTAIVAFHENRRVKAFFARREESGAKAWLRALGALLATGLVVEVALAPIALFHFHKSGLYGALANMVAIPWTTFVIMPLEALALLFDLVGLGAPFWWLTGQAIAALIWLAHLVAGWPGAVASLPSMSNTAIGLMLAGGFWLLLWTRRPRWLGVAPLLAGAALAFAEPVPDIMITRDGRHVTLRGPDGRHVMLRERAGEFVQTVLAERSGEDEELALIDSLPNARCGPDMCIADVAARGTQWRIGATRSAHFLPWRAFVALCPQLDLVVSDRRLPPGCTPRVLKLDRPALAAGGAALITLGKPVRIQRAQGARSDHPWVPMSAPGLKPRGGPASGTAR